MVLDWLGRPGRGASVEALVARGKYEKAIDLLEAEVSAGRRDPRLRLQLADALILAGRDKQAVPVLLELSDEFAREGFAAKAISVLKRVEKISPGRIDVDAKLASLIKERQRARPALPARVAASEMEPNPVPAPPEDEAPPAPARAAGAPAAVVSLAEEVLISIEDALAEAARQEDSADPTSARAAAPGPRPLVQSPLFDDFTEEELLAVIRGLRLVSFEPGDVIVGAGDTGDSLFLLTAGSAKAFVRDGAGRHVLVREMGEGTFFGEISILTGSPRTATVTARTRCDALELDRSALDRISAGHPRVREVLQAFCQHRMDSDEWLARRSAAGHDGP